MFIISTKKFSVNKKSPNIRFYFWSQFFAGDRHWMGLELLHKNPKLCCRILSFQCPHGLIPHFYLIHETTRGLEFKVVSMPSRAYTSFLLLAAMLTIGRQYPTVSMPSRAYTSFLRYPFKNLGFMRFPEPVFAGIYQNILTTAIFRAC